MESETGYAGTAFLTFLGGAALGAGIALLYAPQSGRRTRQRLREFGEDVGDRARDLFDKAEEGVERAARRACQEGDHKGHGCAEEKRRQEEARA